MSNIIEDQIASLKEKQKNLQDETNALLEGFLSMSEAGNLRVSSSGGDFIRPASKFNRDNLFGKVTIVIDDKLADDFQSSDWSVEDVGRKYRHYVTGEMATNDT